MDEIQGARRGVIGGVGRGTRGACAVPRRYFSRLRAARARVDLLPQLDASRLQEVAFWRVPCGSLSCDRLHCYADNVERGRSQSTRMHWA